MHILPGETFGIGSLHAQAGLPTPSVTRPARGTFMEALLLSFTAIAVSEMGDKTQILALCLAARFQRPMPVLLGIFAATLLSNAAAGGLGARIGLLLQGGMLHLLLAASFLGTAALALIPEKTDTCPEPAAAHGIFIAVFISFLLSEMGDKTQLATVALAARYPGLIGVVAGSTLGMMAANIPAVLLSGRVLQKVPLRVMRGASGLVFALLGLYELVACLRA